MNDNFFFKKAKEEEFMIMSHRGFWGGNIIENSVYSAYLAYMAGADIVEVDVCCTVDQKYYLFHDGNELKLFLHTKNFKELSSEEVDNSEVYNSIGSVSGHRINTLTDFLEWLPKGKLVNIDRSWDYWGEPDFFRILKNSGKADQLVLKSPVRKKYLELLAKNGPEFHYIPILKTRNEFQFVQLYEQIDMIGVEIVTEQLDSELLDPIWLSELKEKKYLIIANAENLGADFNLFGKLTDQEALLKGGDWGEIIQTGVNCIQTDWPNFLSEYRRKLIKRVTK